MAEFVITEWHQVASMKSYNVPDEDLIEAFGSIERFEEVLSWHGENPIGDEPTEIEYEDFQTVMYEYDYDREDDWWTDRKGGYRITTEFLEK